MMKRELSGYLLAESSETFTAVALQAADKYTAIIPAIVGDRAASMMVCSVEVSGLEGGTAAGTATTIDVRAYGKWSALHTTNTGIWRSSIGIKSNNAGAASGTLPISASAAGCLPFYVTGVDVESGGMAPIFPYVQLRIDKEGDGTFTAGSVVVSWKLFAC